MSEEKKRNTMLATQIFRSTEAALERAASVHGDMAEYSRAAILASLDEDPTIIQKAAMEAREESFGKRKFIFRIGVDEANRLREVAADNGMTITNYFNGALKLYLRSVDAGK